MARKEFTYKGKTPEELKNLTIKEFSSLTTSRIRRTLKRGFTDAQKIFLENLRKNPNKVIKTHCRDIVIVPEMIGRTVKIHNGKNFNEITIMPEMMGHILGEFALTRNKVGHSSPGVGASRSTANVGKK